jgi:hypothetical protein
MSRPDSIYNVSDDEILGLIRELHNKFGGSYEPKRVIWGRLAQADRPIWGRNAVALSDQLRDKLTLDEWGTLLIAILAFNTKAKAKHTLIDLIDLVGPFLLTAFYLFLVVDFVLPQLVSPNPGVYRGYVSGIFPVFLSGLWLFGMLTTPYKRRLAASSDRYATETMTNRNSLLQVLRKIESMSIPEPSGIKRFLFRPYPIRERIRNLSERTMPNFITG